MKVFKMRMKDYNWCLTITPTKEDFALSLFVIALQWKWNQLLVLIVEAVPRDISIPAHVLYAECLRSIWSLKGYMGVCACHKPILKCQMVKYVKIRKIN